MMATIEFTDWRKSSRSGGGDNCVEVALAKNRAVGVRDSKDPSGPILRFRPTAWKAFTAAVRVDEFGR
jgi:hypothetical protein